MWKYIFATLFFCFCLGTLAEAQELSIRKTDSGNWPNVLVTVELAEQDESAANYTLLLPGGSAPITASGIARASGSSRPASSIVAVDTSRNLGTQYLQALQAALAGYVDALDDKEQLALMAFNEQPQIIADFTSDRKKLKAALGKLRLEGNKTELYRAMLHAIALLKETPGERTLLVVTDGKDEGTANNRSRIIQTAVDNGIRIEAIGIPAFSSQESYRHLLGLRGFTFYTEGMYRTAQTSRELKKITYDLLAGQRALSGFQYELSFTIDSPPPARTTPLKAAVSHARNGNIQSAVFNLDVPALPNRRLPAVPGMSLVIMEPENTGRTGGSGPGQTSPVDNLSVVNAVEELPERPLAQPASFSTGDFHNVRYILDQDISPDKFNFFIFKDRLIWLLFLSFLPSALFILFLRRGSYRFSPPRQ